MHFKYFKVRKNQANDFFVSDPGILSLSDEANFADLKALKMMGAIYFNVSPFLVFVSGQ